MAWRRFFGRGVYPARFASFLEGPWRRLVLSPDKLRERLSLTADSTVCEIGVGGGYYSRAIAPSVSRLLAVDIQLDMLRRMQSKSTAESILPVQADACALPLASETVDLVLAIAVLGEIPAPGDAVHEIARVLRPGGVLSISEHFPDPDYLTFRRVRSMCEASGLDFEVRQGRVWSYTANFRKRTDGHR